MAHPDTHPISFTYSPVASMWVVTRYCLFLYSDLPQPCHPPYGLRIFSSQNFSLYTPTFLKPSSFLGPLLNRKSDLSVRNGVLLYKQLIRLMMDYAYPAWRSAARTHVRRLQVLQSKCLRLATGAPWYVSNRQIHGDMGVPLFAEHNRALTESFDSKLADVGKYGNSADTYADRGLTPSPEAKDKGGRGKLASRGHLPRWPSRLNESRSTLISRAPFSYTD